MSVSASPTDEVVTQSRRRDRNIFSYLAAALADRPMIWLIAKKLLRDFHNRTILGWWWLLIRAVAPTLGIILILQHFDLLQTPELPYPLYVISGMLLWTAVDIGIMKGTRCIYQVRRLMQHVYFPRIIVPIAANALPILYHLVFVVLFIATVVGFWLITGQSYVKFGPALLLVPVLICLMFALLTGLVCIFSVIFVIARDIRFSLPFIRQIWFLATPVLYPLEILPSHWREVLMYGNPAAPIVETLRWSLFGIGQFEPVYMMTSVVQVVVTCLLGIWVVMRSERLLKAVI